MTPQAKAAIGRLVSRAPDAKPATLEKKNWAEVLWVGIWARDVARECWPSIVNRSELNHPELERLRVVHPDDATAALWIARLHRILMRRESIIDRDDMDFAIAALADPPMTMCDYITGVDKKQPVIWIKTYPRNERVALCSLSWIVRRTLRCVKRLQVMDGVVKA